MFNKNEIQGRWTEFKGEVQKMWGDLTQDEIERTQGDLTALRGLVQRRYGETQKNWRDSFDRMAKKYGIAREEGPDSPKHSSKN